MRQLKTDILIFIAILLLALIIFFSISGQASVDIQVHDTYYVIDKISLTALIIGPITFLIFLIRGIRTSFKLKGANIGLIVGLLLLMKITYLINKLQQSQFNELMRLYREGVQNDMQFIQDLGKGINWIWGILGFGTLGLLLLIIRTLKNWKVGDIN